MTVVAGVIALGSTAAERRIPPDWPTRLAEWVLPALALAVPLACSPALADSFELPKLAVLRLGLGAALLAFVVGALFDRVNLRMPAVLAALLFFGVNLLATVTALEPRTAFLGRYGHGQGLLTLAVYLGFFLLAAATIRTEQALARVAVANAAAAGAIGAYALGQFIGFDPLGWEPQIEDGRRVYGTVGHPNTLAEYLVLSVPLTAWLAWRGRGLRRDLPLWSLAGQVTALALTQSRGGWFTAIGIGVLAAIVLAYRGRWLWQWPAWLLGLLPQAVLLAAVVAVIASPSVANQVDAAVSTFMSRGDPLETRHFLWRSAAAMIADRPILGWGPDTFDLGYQAYRSAELDAREGVVGRDDAIHNAALTVGVNSGLLGVAAYLLLHWVIALLLAKVALTPDGSRLSAAQAAALALLLTWVGYSALYTVGERRVTTEWLFWVVAGAAVGLFGNTVHSHRIRTPPYVRLVLALLTVVLMLGVASAVLADVAYAEGINRLRGGAPESGLVALGTAVSLHPLEPVYRGELGHELVNMGSRDTNAHMLERGVGELTIASWLLGHRDAYVLARLARATTESDLMRNARSDRAASYLDRAIALDPKNPFLYMEASNLALREERREDAGLYWQEAKTRTLSPDAFSELGYTAARLGDLRSARDAHREAAQREWRAALQPGRYRAWGDAALAAGLAQEALGAFDAALDRNPRDAVTRLKRAEALATLNRRSEALREAERVLELVPSDPRARALVQELGGVP